MKASNECFLSFSWVGVRLRTILLHFLALRKNFRAGYTEVFLKCVLLAVFAEEGPKKGVDLINGVSQVSVQLGNPIHFTSEEIFDLKSCTQHKEICNINRERALCRTLRVTTLHCGKSFP